MKQIVQLLYNKHFWPSIILFATFGLYFFTLFPRMITLQPTGLYLGHEHVWSDWPLHIGMIHTFATKSPEHWFLHHPMYAHGKFTYSFLTNLISSLFMRVGFSLENAITVPSLIFVTALLGGLYTLSYQLFKSRLLALITIAIFFLSSGPGFIAYINDVFVAPNSENILYPAKHYSRLDEYSWYAGNIIVGMIVPQRAFLLGITLGVWILVGLISRLQSDSFTKNDKIILCLAGIVAGVLTIAHVHSFISIIIISGSLFIFHYKQWNKWLYYTVPAIIISTILYTTFIAGGIENKQFMTFQLGYTAKGSFLDWIIMWYRLWGLTIPAAIIGFFLLRSNQTVQRSLLIGFLLIFVIANVILFQPVEWDNAKFFAWSYLGFAILAGVLIHTLCNFKHKAHILFKLVAVFLFILLTATGFVELLRLQHIERNAYMAISMDDMQLARTVREQTDETAIFLTAPSTNHWVMMWAARPIMMGFVGWVNNFGFLYQQRLKDIHTIYAGGDETKPLIKHYQISYVVIGNGELNDFSANEAYFRRNFPLRFENRSNRVYDVRQ